MRAHLETPPLVNTDPAKLSEADRAAMGVVRLPATLAKALQALAADAEARSWFPPDLLQALISVKAREAALAANDAPDEL